MRRFFARRGSRGRATRPWEEVPLYIAIAVVLATAASVVFAVGATVQSGAVGRAVDDHASDPENGRVVGGRAMLSLLRSPAWLASVGIIVIGGLLHAVALALAPISIVQPIGVLAIPFAVLIAARRLRQNPGGAVMTAVAITMLAVVAFVLAAASDGHNAASIDALEVAWSAVGIAVIAAILAVGGSIGPKWLRCAAWASAGAVVYGLASALLRTDMMLVAQHGPWHLNILGYTAAVLFGFGIGGWFLQHAHANGPPAVVLGSLTVVDPIVAVIFGLAFLGEGAHLAPTHVAVMVLSGVVAAIGVVMLSRHHPEGRPETATDPDPSEHPVTFTNPQGSNPREEHTP